MNLVLQRESTDEPFGLDVARVDGQLHIQEVMSEPRLLKKFFFGGLAKKEAKI